MTKEELEKEAEEWIKAHSGLIGSYKFVKFDYDSMQKAYLAGAEPREKRIADLERKLEQTEKDLTDYQFNYPKIKDFEKENAELKIKNKNADSLNNKLEEDNYNLTCNLNATLDRLNEATELLKATLLMAQVEGLKVRYETVDDIEQFLKSEVKK